MPFARDKKNLSRKEVTKATNTRQKTTQKKQRKREKKLRKRRKITRNEYATTPRYDVRQTNANKQQKR